MIIDESHKKCGICEEIKNITEFHKKKGAPLGCTNKCKICSNKISKEHRANTDSQKRNDNCKEWRKNNKGYESTPERKEYRAKWRELNSEKIAKQTSDYVKKNKKHLREVDKPKRKIRYKKKLEDPLFKIRESVRCSIRRTIKNKGFKKTIKTDKILGCSYLEFKIYLESKFEPWMNYDNYGKYNGELNFGWDIDHIIPASKAKTEDEIIKLNHYTNLQPLCSKINRDIKRDNI